MDKGGWLMADVLAFCWYDGMDGWMDEMVSFAGLGLGMHVSLCSFCSLAEYSKGEQRRTRKNDGRCMA